VRPDRPAPHAADAATPYARAPFDGRRFANLSGRAPQGLGGVLRWLITRQRSAWPSAVDAAPAFAPPPTRVADGAIHATVIGHATVLLQVDGLNLLTDPVFSARIGPAPWLGIARVRPPAIALADLPPIDVVLLSHNHYDHLDRPSLAALHRRDRPLVLTGLRVGRDVPRGLRVHEMDWWQTHDLAPGVRATYVRAEHFSGRGAFDRDATLWGGFVLETPSGRVFFAGDTGAGRHFADIRARFGPMTLSLLPIGAYAPRWFMQSVHIDPAEALAASLALESQVSLAIHHATFRLSDEAIDAPVHDLARALAAAPAGRPGTDFRVTAFGETLAVRRRIESVRAAA
jgi:L-ascorbate metabolism protein UlaG (beta-lactamase superfamily)